MTLLDVVLFAGERDMLELRLRTVGCAVDAVIAVACTKTHQGDDADVEGITNAFYSAVLKANMPRPTHLHWVEPQLNLYDGTIGRTYVRPKDERGPAGSFWFQKVEQAHRNGCADAARWWSTDEDTIVCVSDVDEIPDVDMLQTLARGWVCDQSPWWTFPMRMHSTALDLLHPQQPWFGTTVSRLKDLRPQEMRDARTTIGLPNQSILPVGSDLSHSRSVHLSWMGTDEERATKLRTFSHAEHADWDHARGRAEQKHINGEQLVRFTDEQMAELWWPVPIADGSFVVPESWRAS